MMRHKVKISFLSAMLAMCFAWSVLPSAAQTSEQDERVERAIDRGLAFLSSRQNPDGSFASNRGRTVGVVGLAGMAFLAKGHLPDEEPYGEVLNRCVDYMLATHSSDSGWMGQHNGRMYSHAIGALFLSEISGMIDPERQQAVDELLGKAVRLILTAQAVEKSEQHRGGWRYNPSSNDSDMSVTGWALMALRSARLNGAPVPVRAIDDAVAYTLRHHDRNRGTFGYQDTHRHAPTLTGAGLLSLALTGRHDHPAAFAAARYLMQSFRSLPNQSRAFYGLYYTSQGLFQIGGEEWQTFSDWMVDYWLPRQRHDGSWDRGEENCPVYQTAMCILSLTVPYRQLPIYQRDETVDED